MSKIVGVPIRLYSRDVPLPILEDYQLAVWNYWNYTNNRKVWGLIHIGYPTHMNYGLDYAKPREAIERRREKAKTNPDPDWLRFYFDVGARLYSTLDDLEEACKNLGIWDEQ